MEYMTDEIFQKIDKLIENVDKYRVEPIFLNELTKRKNKIVPDKLTDKEIMETFITLIAYSQNANSKIVGDIISTGILKKIFCGFDVEKISKMNPCDLADEYWGDIAGIRQQAKLFHIVSLSRKIERIGSFHELLTETNIPKTIKNESDIKKFWVGFQELKKTMINNKIPFFRSAISLLHLLLEMGYDCVKPDLVVMKVSQKIGIVEKETGEKNLISTVQTIQKYSVAKKIKPSVIDFYFLIDEGQKWAKQFVEKEFYTHGHIKK